MHIDTLHYISAVQTHLMLTRTYFWGLMEPHMNQTVSFEPQSRLNLIRMFRF